MRYLYETHLHTAGVSKCAISAGADYVAPYADKGYTGIMVTDHFFNANTAISRKLPWEKWVNNFYSGFEKTRDAGAKYGLDVFFGWEETFESCDDYLIYGLDKQWLLEHPEVRKWTRREQYLAVKASGGCVVQAHPFRQRYYISRIVLSAGCSDAVEVMNGGHEDGTFDYLAYCYAKKTGKPMTSGTDIHDASIIEYGDAFGVYLDKKLESINDYVNIILNKEYIGLKTDESRIESQSELYSRMIKEDSSGDHCGSSWVHSPVEIRDENDKITGRHWKEYIF